MYSGNLKIGNIRALTSLVVILATGSALAHADDGLKFNASVDRSQVALDESVSLQFSVESDGSTRAGSPQFTAPGFEVMNEYQSNQIQSYYDGTTGKFGMKSIQTLTKVLKPLRTGNQRIFGISVLAQNGKRITAPDITVQVVGAGAGSPPPRGYGGPAIGLRGVGKKPSGRAVMVRAEVDKDRVYKGEQVVVSYYLYRRVKVFNIQVDKFPILNGFLREDLEMPVMGQRLESERVISDGVAYERSLLLRYAAYPLQEGKLKIDSTSIKYAYYASPGGDSLDEEDPFMGFFRQMTPRAGGDRSEQLNIEVLPLPEEGKPGSFTGGVGDFSISASVDKTDVRANESVTLTFKVNGRGNLAAIGEPKAKWPQDIELYDSKGTAKTGRAGVGEKVFEYLLIPRNPGKLVLPALELSYFDPAKKSYVTKSTEAIAINVQSAAPGSVVASKTKSLSPATLQATPEVQEPAGFLPMDLAEGSSPRFPYWRVLYWLAIALASVFAGMVIYDLFRRTKARSAAMASSRAEAYSRSWANLREKSREASQGASWQEVIRSYELLAGLMFDSLDQAFDVSARSRPRSELGEMLVQERGVSQMTWDRISKLLEYVETVRFAISAGAVTEASARKDLARWVSEGEAVARELGERRKKDT